ncbi:response regulator transcription factor [uncultured Arcticibacterium sp.]|uniref:response regulator transcription factor n=1 Tax=uncultured Arcticibacterium sp. TaxID=2173042 RepID=UPI0030F855A1
MSPKILIADDHQLFGNGLKELLQKDSLYEVHGPIMHEDEIKHTISDLRPHVLLLDINLNGINGIQLGKVLKSNFPDLKIIIITMYENLTFLAQSKEAELNGYLLKDCETSELLNGIREVLNGGTCFVEMENDFFESETFKDSFLEKYNITEREMEIMNHLKNGRTNEEIAKRLFLSFHTVKTHRKNIYNKLGVSNVAELIDFASQNP